MALVLERLKHGGNELDVSVIIVSWNTKDLLRDCINSVYQQTSDISYEVIVVDNASSDGSAEMVRDEFPKVRLITEKINRGYACAVNAGISVSTGKYILALNSDIVICDKAIEKTFHYAYDHPEAAVIGCQVRDNDNKIHMTCRGFPSLFNLVLDTLGLNRLFLNNKFFGREWMLWWPRDTERPVDVISGMFMLVRRRAIEEVGLMDERFFFLFEETDWCYRFDKVGWKMLFWPGTYVIHVHGGKQSRKKAGIKIAVQYQKSLLIFFRKYYGITGLCFARVLLTIQNVMKCVFWFSLGLSRKIIRRDAQHQNDKLRLCWWSLWFCVLGIEPEKDWLKRLNSSIYSKFRSGLEIGFAIGYRLFSLIQRKPPPKVVLYYHALKPNDINNFDKQMRYLARHCRVVRASDILRALPDRSMPVVAIIFDDAFDSFRRNALPILARYGLTASVAVPTGIMGKVPDWVFNGGNIDTDETVLDEKGIAEIERKGCEIMSHTVSHRNLTLLDKYELEDELLTSRKNIEQILGHQADCVTYPYGACNAAVREAADRAGYQLGFTIEPLPVYSSTDPLCIGRFKVLPNESMFQFKLKTYGAYSIVRYLRKVKQILPGKS